MENGDRNCWLHCYYTLLRVTTIKVFIAAAHRCDWVHRYTDKRVGNGGKTGENDWRQREISPRFGCDCRIMHRKISHTRPYLP